MFGGFVMLRETGQWLHLRLILGVIPFWSEQKLAEELCSEEWSVYKPVAIAMEEFLDDWLTGMHEDVHRAGINWNHDLEGQELEPLDLLEEFESELD